MSNSPNEARHVVQPSPFGANIGKEIHHPEQREGSPDELPALFGNNATAPALA